ncbi:MAG: glycosyltransferase family 4 protein [Anaerolineales bacterium]
MEELCAGQAGCMSAYSGRVGLVQRVLPAYRAPFFDMLAEQCLGGLSVIAGEPRPNEAIAASRPLHKATVTRTRNLHLLSGPFYLCWQQGLIGWLKQWDPDILIVEANSRYLSTPPAIRWMKQRSRPVIGWGLGALPLYGLLAKLRQSRRRAFLSQFDALIAYSQRGAQEYGALGFPHQRIYVAPNAVAPRPEGQRPQHATALDGKATLLYVGRLQARKRLNSLLHALAGLPKELQPRLQIVGDGPVRGELEQLAVQIYPAAQFTGVQYGQALEELFVKADLFVLPGTGGLAIQQALTHGLPLIVTEGDGSQKDLVTPANGWLLPAGDVAALRDALSEALSDPARLRRMGAESFRLAQEKFNLEAMVAGFVTALNEVCN